jgi:hypothetical protein
MAPGRNESCPCGSGTKYKRCCGMTDAGQGPADNPAAQFNAKLADLIGDRKFDSMEALQAFLDAQRDRQNSQAVNDFHGLSPNQMHNVLYEPFTSPQVAAFRLLPDDMAADVRMVAVFRKIAAAVGEKGLKATGQGNLPRNLCRAIFSAHPSGHRFLLRNGAASIMKEEDFGDLHIVRVTAEAAGLLCLTKGKWFLTKKGHEMAANPRKAYAELFRTYTTKVNWGYTDAMLDLPFIQQSFLFTLYLLQRYGARPRPASYYAEAFLKAFPVIERDVNPLPGWTAVQEITQAYILRALSRFAVSFGLAEEEGDSWALESRVVKSTSVLDRLVDFRAPV